MELIRKKAQELGLDVIAVTHAEPFPEAYHQLTQLQESNLYPEFAEQDLELRINPKHLLPTVKSLISVALGYETVRPKIQPLSGTLARYAWGEDYHHVFPALLNQLALWLQEKFQVQEYKIAVDTSPLIDRAIALRAGLGWLGKNCCVFAPNLGSWIFLGTILIDQELPTTNPEPLQSKCPADCNRCIQACPTGALFAPYQINPQICISYLTQMKGIIPRHLRNKIGRNLWGCDICQQVCPENQKTISPNHDFFQPIEGTSILVIPLLNISNREFKKRFGKTALAWRGRGIIQRNAAIVAGNLKTTEAIDELAKSVLDPKPMVRATAVWALQEIGTAKAQAILDQVSKTEQDPTVLAELV